MIIVTDTATLVIYDPIQLQHRINDDFDWWSDPVEELLEINQGNALFVGLEDSGAYDISYHNSGAEHPLVPGTNPLVQAKLKNTSGQFYIGPAESVTSEGEEPVESPAGHFIDIEPGSYEVSLTAHGNQLDLWITPITAEPSNTFEKTLILAEGVDNLDDSDISHVLQSIFDHLESAGYVWDDREDDTDIVFFSEDYGYIMIEPYEGGVRFFTNVEYDREKGLADSTDEEWQLKLFSVLDHFNASAIVVRAYDDTEEDQIILDAWYPAVYSEHAFSVFLELWHEDITANLEEAEEDIFGTHVLH